MVLREEMREKEKVTEALVRAERDRGAEMGEAFDSYEDAFDRIYTALEEENPYFYMQHTDQEETLKFLTENELLQQWHNGFYRAEASEEELEMFEERFEAYSERGYDDFELIVRYRLEAEDLGKTPSARDARASDHMPSPNPYNSRYQKWSNAKWRAGFEGHERLGKDLLLEKLNNAIHKANSGRPIEEYELPSGTEIDELDDAPTERSLRDNDEIGSYHNALEMLGFSLLNGDEEKNRWSQDFEKTVKKSD